MSPSVGRISRLQSLQDKLIAIPPFERGRVEAWIAEATPVIQSDWPTYFEVFRENAKPPRWRVKLSAIEYADRFPDSPVQDNETNRQMAETSHQKLVSFIDGVLRCADDEPADMAADQIDPRNVFVVHGRNMPARNAMFSFLRAAGLNPIEWDEAVRAVGHGSPYPGDVIQKGFAMARAAVVLFTPDDEARLRAPYQKRHDPVWEKELTPQPRPNVLIEAGMALGMHPNRTVIVEMGDLRPMTDLLGRHTIRMDGSAEQRKSFLTRLETAGCAVSFVGTDWLRAGDFKKVLKDINKVKSTREPARAVAEVKDEPKLFPSDGLLWSVRTVGGHRSYIEHCPRCAAPLKRSIDFVKCQKCGFEELSAAREPRNIPAEFA